MPVYDLSAVAEALDLSPKQLDNILCRNAIPGVERHRRGVARRLSPNAVVLIRLARDLADTLGLTTASALHVAREVERRGSNGLRVGECAFLTVDLAGLRATTAERLNAAVEAVGRRRRGRPPRRAPR